MKSNWSYPQHTDNMQEISRNLYLTFMNLWWLALPSFHLVEATALADLWALFLTDFVCFFYLPRCSTNWSGTQCERPAPKSSKSDHISTSKFLRLISWVFHMYRNIFFLFISLLKELSFRKLSLIEFCKRSITTHVGFFFVFVFFLKIKHWALTWWKDPGLCALFSCKSSSQTLTVFRTHICKPSISFS